MKKKNVLIVFIILLGGAIYLAFKPTSSDLYTYNLNGKQLHLLVADTEPEREKGLMFIKKLDNADGMIFLFPDAQYLTFWNKNTLMDLTLYWIHEDRVIGTSELPSITKSKQIVTVNSPDIADKVIEMPKN